MFHCDLASSITHDVMIEFLQTTQSKGGYSLHGQQGDKVHGNERAGFLQKRSEG